MNELQIRRHWFSDECTIGELTFGSFTCYTLEDRVRAPGVKVPRETAIPAGRYQVIVNWSNRFLKQMPLLLNVPMFTGIRIHSGNTAADTEGCILVGLTSNGTHVFDSRRAFQQLYPMIEEAQPELWVTISDEPEADARTEA